MHLPAKQMSRCPPDQGCGGLSCCLAAAWEPALASPASAAQTPLGSNRWGSSGAPCLHQNKGSFRRRNWQTADLSVGSSRAALACCISGILSASSDAYPLTRSEWCACLTRQGKHCMHAKSSGAIPWAHASPEQQRYLLAGLSKSLRYSLTSPAQKGHAPKRAGCSGSYVLLSATKYG